MSVYQRLDRAKDQLTKWIRLAVTATKKVKDLTEQIEKLEGERVNPKPTRSQADRMIQVKS